MAFPEKMSDVHTNLSKEEYEKVKHAIETSNNKVKWLKSVNSYDAFISDGEFFYDGKKYYINETIELVTTLEVVGLAPDRVPTDIQKRTV